ncbi:MAG: aconitase X swivel domain-containing protein [Alphaproteobacteria bacterium]
MTEFRAKVVIDGSTEGRVLRLAAPISFWGGVDPASGRVIDARHPDRGLVIGGRILCLPGMIGSSSASAVMLELLRAGLAPAALILGESDAILALGVVVGRELGYPAIPILELAASEQAKLPQGALVRIGEGGVIRLAGNGS